MAASKAIDRRLSVNNCSQNSVVSATMAKNKHRLRLDGPSSLPSLIAVTIAHMIFFTTAIISYTESLPNQIKIGALIGPNEEQQEHVLKSALAKINQDNILLPKTRLIPRVENVTLDDSFDADRKACSLLNDGVVAILGPMSGSASQHVQAICDSLEVPHIEIQPDLGLRRIDLAINLYPPYTVLTKAYIDLIQSWNWTSFAVVYETSEAMIRLQDIFKELNGIWAKKWSIRLFQLKENTKYRDLFWVVKKSGEQNIVLDVKIEHMYECLKHAQQVGLMTEKQSYLITSLDLQTIDLEDFMYGKTKITSLRLIDHQNPDLAQLVKDVNTSNQMQANRKRYDSRVYSGTNVAGLASNRPTKSPTQSSDLLVQSALIYDAIHLLANGIKELDSGQSINIQSLLCDNPRQTWQFGSSIVNYMRSLSFKGLTGLVAFDQSGRRSGITFDVMSLSEQGLEKIGYWAENGNTSLNIDQNVFNKYFVPETDAIDTLVVTTKRTKPYFMLRSTPNKQEGNDQYEGYAVDVIHELSKIVGFRYIFKEVEDGKYGVKTTHPNGTVTWNGIIGEIVNNVADLAIVDLTITSQREEAVDFTLPFMNTGISILFKKPTNKVTTLFSFLSPFSVDVWVYVLCAYSGVSLILFIVGRISPYEWTNPYPCRQEDQVMHNSFSLPNSFWFTIGSLMQQGSDLAPKSMSTRTMAGIWYFFTLIMISSYTANLAAFLTVEKVVYPIENAKDLSEQTEIKYGCVESGSTRTFFAESQIETYKKIRDFMEHHKTFVKSNEEGKERVEQGNFAFFMESTSIEYITERNCNLTQIGNLLDSKNYGIATRKNSTHKRPYRTLLSQGILQLQENGMLHVLKNRWWKERHGVGTCSDDNKGGQVTELSLANVGGVFVVLLGGLGFSFLVAIAENFYEYKIKGRRTTHSVCDQMMQDLKFALSCKNSTKPMRKRLTSQDSKDSYQ